jgi:hypothetical protein
MKVLDEAYLNYKQMMKLADYPDCFRDEKQYKSWTNEEEIAHTKPRGLPCRDCTPEYKKRMTEEGRCAQGKVVNIERIMQRDSQS